MLVDHDGARVEPSPNPADSVRPEPCIAAIEGPGVRAGEQQGRGNVTRANSSRKANRSGFELAGLHGYHVSNTRYIEGEYSRWVAKAN